MKVSNAISIRVSKIIQKKQFVKDILQSIEKMSGRALLVGGAVRDLFFNVPIKDLDFEVYGLTAEQLEKILQNYGIVSLVGKSFGVFKLHGLDIDWSLPRQDSSGRHPVVQYDPNMSYQQAFARRDLTINAMGLDMQTFDLIDPFHGLSDLEHKILRAPDLHFFVQDPLRVLRVMQFAGRFSMQVDDQLSEVCKSVDMSKVSQERIEQEFRKLFLQAQQPSIGLRWLLKIDKFSQFLPGIENFEQLCHQLDLAAEQSYQSDHEKIVIMWAVVLSCFKASKVIETFAPAVRLEKQSYIDFMRRIHQEAKIIQQAVDCIVYARKLPQKLSDVQMKWLAVWLAPDCSVRTLCTFMHIYAGEQKALDLLQQAERLGVVDQPETQLLQGKDFLDIVQGVQLGVLVKKSYQLQIEQGIRDKNKLKQLVLQNHL